jgi:integrase
MTLTSKRIVKLTEPGRYGDGRGLYLQVTDAGVRSWILRYERNGRERAMGLGPVGDFTIEEARERARKARQQLSDGIDPIDARRAERARQATEAALAAAKNVSFEQCARQYFDHHSSKWHNAKHRGEFISSLKRYAFSVIGKLPVAAIDKTLVLKVLQKDSFWQIKTRTAGRVRGRIESILDYAKVQGWRAGENPAGWDGNLEHALPATSSIAPTKHHNALAFAEVHNFVSVLRARNDMAARALEFLILTATRTGEVIGARWSEIDLSAKTWTIPAARMKTGRKTGKEHRIPLCDRAIAILQALPREADFVFFGSRKNKPLSHDAFNQLQKRMKRREFTVHGMRSTFRDWAAEKTTYPNHVVEMALAHAIGNKVEAAYRRGDLFEQRRQLMGDWARYCETAQHEATVTSIRARV